MPPLADFVCNSPKCRRKDGSAPVYELPVKATHCPMGHKRLTRLYNMIRVNTGAKPDHFDGRHTSSSAARRLDALVEKPMEEALSKRSDMKHALLPGQRFHGDMGLVRPVPIKRLAGEVAKVSSGQFLEEGLDAVARAPMERTEISGSREERLKAARAKAGQSALGHTAPTVAPLIEHRPLPATVAARDREFTIVKGKDGPEVAKA